MVSGLSSDLCIGKHEGVIPKVGLRGLVIDAYMRKGQMERYICIDSKPYLAD